MQSIFDPLGDENQEDMGVELYITIREFVKHCNLLNN